MQDQLKFLGKHLKVSVERIPGIEFDGLAASGRKRNQEPGGSQGRHAIPFVAQAGAGLFLLP
jgi:hypothetical protein